MNSAQVRQAFLDFFAAKQHQIVSSSSLIPGNDPTLLFTNAGMVQFKDTFLGVEQRDYNRATSSQRCVRAGGKHNDLENVGYTARHHTFFEMLGNFSFGDYFKQQAIEFAWEFLTEVLKLPAEKLWVTVYKDDQEAEDLWLNHMKHNPEMFSRCGEADNFWSMGDTGPCGPCTEIFYDHGPDVPGGPPGSPDEDGDRYIEIWNLVFMQYDRDASGKLTPLPKPSVDTGMGLERISAIMQGVHSNYNIDLFQHLIKAAGKLTGCKDLSHNSLKVIADHIRSTAFLITDGVIPSNEGRGYVLRRIIRRACRHGHKLGQAQPFFAQLIVALGEVMGQAYPELIEQQDKVKTIIEKEEQQFARTLDHGMGLLKQAMAELDGSEIPGATAFKLYDTYGFPLDLTADVAREHELTVDVDGFNEAMAKQRLQSQEGDQFANHYHDNLDVHDDTDFSGYEKLSDQGKVTHLFVDGQVVEQCNAGDKVIVVLDNTPFYAESGGQVGDVGTLSADGAQLNVFNTTKQSKSVLHHAEVVQGKLNLNDKLTAEVDGAKRRDTMAHHSATHLLHAALRQLLGDHVTQKGSLVAADKLRFDFSHFNAVSLEEQQQLEQLVNQHIRANHEVVTTLASIDNAKAMGAMALFGEKYDSEVRVLGMGEFSLELCGGTHVKRTGDIGYFKITAEMAIASGVRRIEAVVGEAAVELLQQQERQLFEASQLLKTDKSSVVERVQALLTSQRQQDKAMQQLQAKLASSQGNDLMSHAVEIQGIKCLVAKLEGVEAKALRDMVDQLKQKLEPAVVVLAISDTDKVNIAAGVTKNLTQQIKAGELVNFVAQQVGGKGGGRPDFAQAGGKQPEQLGAALQSVEQWVSERMS